VLRAAFLDRDGVINRKAPEGDYIKCWEEFEFLPGVAEAIKALNERCFKVFVVTNQRGIARGLLTENGLKEIHEKMTDELRKAGAEIDGIYYCPHEKDSCSCRKPETGMFLEAKRDFPAISFHDSSVVGDSLSDMEAGKILLCRCILVGDSHRCSDEWFYRARSLYDAVVNYVIDGCL
jgi:D-glycero-D-manno-heptose 1,7-bisphosphate phosphatase